MPMMRVQLRAMEPRDLEAMHALDHLCFEEPFRFSWSSMRRFASQPNAIGLVAEFQAVGFTGRPNHGSSLQVPGELAGFTIVHVDRRDQSAYLVTLDVHPSARRHGLAERMVAELEGKSAAAGARSMHLHVYSGNEIAIRLYERWGYRRLNLEKNLYADGFDAWTYSKPLELGRRVDC
jgi:ribosomal-protein-alanine N-acetyltransferase